MFRMNVRTGTPIGPERGLKAREEAARARLARPRAEEIAENLKLAADRLQAERDAAAAFAVEQDRIRRSTACPCPACSGGEKQLSVEEAAFVASALAYYRSHNLKVDPDQYAAMNLLAGSPDMQVRGAVIVSADAYNNAPDLGAILAAQTPAPMAHDDAPGDDADALAVYVREEAAREAEIVALSRRAGTEVQLGTVTVSGTEADLAAVADAVRERVSAAVAKAADPQQRPTQPKASRKHVAPPFLDGDE